LKRISRTTRHAEDASELWERFTTKGVPKEDHQYLSFGAHYMLNEIPKADPFTDKALYSYYRTTDMVRCTGIALNLNLFVNPCSGWKFRVMVVQSPIWINDMGVGDVEDQRPKDPTLAMKHGYYALSGTPITHFKKEDIDITAVNPIKIGSFYGSLFGFQRQDFALKPVQDCIHNFRVNAHNVQVLRDFRFKVVNRKKKPRYLRWNRMCRMNTTWKYHSTRHNGINVEAEDVHNIPDRKLWMLVLATPMHGPDVRDPKQDQFGIQGPRNPDHDDNFPMIDELNSVPRRFPSVDPRFGDPPEDAQDGLQDADDEADPPDAAPPRAGSQPRMTRAQSAAASTIPDTIEETEIAGPARHSPIPEDAPLGVDLLDDDEDHRNAYLNAMRINREELRRERVAQQAIRERERAARAAEKDAQRAEKLAERERKQREKAERPGDPDGKLDIDEFGWNKENTIMFRPTMHVFWREMRFKKLVRTVRFGRGKYRR
jgi:hypothetical protein